MNNIHFSSNNDNWGTPQQLYDALNKEFKFTLDACADETNYKHLNYYDINKNGLEQSWINQTVFCNPPYSRGNQTNWVKKCYAEHVRHKITVVMLLPSRTDTKIFHDFILNKAEIRFIRGRLKFEIDRQECKNSAPFPSMIVIFRKNKRVSEEYIC